MGSTAEEIVQDDIVEENLVEKVEPKEPVEPVEPELDDDGNAIVAEEPAEIEIVREGTQPQFTQQQVNDIVNKRVKRLNGKVSDATDTSTQTNAELDLANEKNKLLEIALEQAKAAKVVEVTAPNPTDFEEGAYDPGFIAKQEEYTQSIISKQVAEGIAKATQSVAVNTDQTNQSQALLKKQVKHYERAEEIGAKDYGATEDIALDIIGNENANHIINNFEDSHVILYYLGKNPQEATRISNLLKTNAIKGVAEMGRLSSELKIRPKTKIIADPDEEVQGADGNTQDGEIERKLNKLRDTAAKTGNMKALMDFKRKNKL